MSEDEARAAVQDSVAASERISKRLAEAVDMEQTVTISLFQWQAAIFHLSFQDTANRALQVVTNSGDFLGALVVSDRMDRFTEAFIGGIAQQNAPDLLSEENTDSLLSLTIPLSALVTMTSMAIQPLTTPTLDTPRPTTPPPAPEDQDAMVSQIDMLWWAITTVISQFPQPLPQILAEETGLDLSPFEQAGL